MRSIASVDFHEFHISNRGLWDNLPEDIVKDVLQKADSGDVISGAYLPLSLFRLFRKTGDRVSFEKVYFDKRRIIGDLVIAECIGNDGRFIEKIEEAVWALLSEPAWVIHAHNSYIRDTEQLDAPLLERPVLDLFACETGEILALTRCVLSGRLSPVIEKDIEHALYTRIVLPYINDSFWWMGGCGPLNNWSPWCTQNVLIAALSLDRLDERERFKVIRQATTTLDSFMASYGDDGGCDEGASYYHAAALALFGALVVLEKACGVPFDGLWNDRKLKAMAYFVEAVHVDDDIYLNYADCSPKAGRLKAREYLFAKMTGLEDMMHHAALDYMATGWREEDNDYNLFYKLLGLSCHDGIEREAARDVSFHKPAFMYFGKTQMGIWRHEGITFSIKGGCNGESHNHNDVGSLILYDGVKPLLVDIGVETYTKTTFSPMRYTLKPMQSGYHNLVNFPPIEQKDGEDFKAGDVHMDEGGAHLDLTGAYPCDDRLKRYERSVSFDWPQRSISITEDFECGVPAVLTLMSQEKPSPQCGRIVYDSFTIELEGPSEATVEPFPVTDERLRKAWPDMLYRTLVVLKGSTTWKIHVK